MLFIVTNLNENIYLTRRVLWRGVSYFILNIVIFTKQMVSISNKTCFLVENRGGMEMAKVKIPNKKWREEAAAGANQDGDEDELDQMGKELKKEFLQDQDSNID